jgi:SOS response regulatory protein OraA/RecX
VVKTVSALRAERRGRVLVELDGERWRALPAEVVAATRLRVGETLERPRLRELARELRRAEALGRATRALKHRDLSTHALAERLDRAGVAERDRTEALETLERVGYVDDDRFARRRAQTLAERDWGDAAIADDLEQQGVPRDLATAAIAVLEPERERAKAIAGARGRSRKTAGYLARKGFGEDALEAVLGAAVADEG